MSETFGYAPHTEPTAVDYELTLERLFQALITGNRNAARSLVNEAAAEFSPEEIAQDFYWPLMETISTLFRNDQLTTLAHHYATRLLRSLLDQAQMHFTCKPRRQRKVMLFSGRSETEELGGQLVADLAEADGYEVFFAGGGVSNDEVLAEIGEQKPDVLLLFACASADAPNIRRLIDEIRGVNACPELQIVVGGGVFNRADGLAEEIGADLWAKSPREMLRKLEEEPKRRATPTQRTVGKSRQKARSAAA